MKATEKGGLKGSGRIRRSKENQGHQAQCHRRYESGSFIGIAVIQPNIQDRDCAGPSDPQDARHLFPWIAKIFADGGYAGAKLKAALAGQPVELEIVKRSTTTTTVVSRSCAGDGVIERTLSLLRRNRRLDGPLRSVRHHR